MLYQAFFFSTTNLSDLITIIILIYPLAVTPEDLDSQKHIYPHGAIERVKRGTRREEEEDSNLVGQGRMIIVSVRGADYLP